MTREIKYKVWDKEKKVMYEEGDFFDGKGGYVVIDGCKRRDVELRQWTGLKDKNGKEIYEGDILHNKSEVRFIIEWDNEAMRFVVNKSRWGLTTKAIKRDGYEIIGNRFENPELLEAKIKEQ